MYRRLPPAVTLAQAADGSPKLARLADLARDSSARLKAVDSLLPDGLRSVVKAGPVEGSTWCLLVNSPAAAAKLRQVLPLLQDGLRARGWVVDSIRVKVQRSS